METQESAPTSPKPLPPTPPPRPNRNNPKAAAVRQNSVAELSIQVSPPQSEAPSTPRQAGTPDTKGSFSVSNSELQSQLLRIRSNSVVRIALEPNQTNEDVASTDENAELSPEEVAARFVAATSGGQSNPRPSTKVGPAPPPKPSAEKIQLLKDALKPAVLRYASEGTVLSRSNSFSSISSRSSEFRPVADSQQTVSIDSILEYNPMADKFPEHRDKVARELFTTEQSYVRNLRFLEKEYIKPLDEIIGSKDIFVIFSCITQILKVNEELIKKLYEKIKNWSSEATLADAMQSLIPFLKMYTQYCVGFDDAVKKIQELEKQNPRFLQFITDLKQKDGANGLDIRSFLIMPVQRIPRYTLLLGDIVKHTNDGHADYNGLCQALEQVRIVASRINEAIREQESRNRILQIQQRFNGEIQLVDPHRRFIKEGNLVKVCRKEDKRRMFYLFNDLLIYGQKAADGSVKLSQQISMNDLSIADDSCQDYFGFTVRSLKKSFVVKTDSQDEKDAWMLSIDDTLREFKKSLGSKKGDEDTEHAPVWKQDSTTTSCAVCSIKFTLTNRRHHCRKCGDVVCGACSTKKLFVTGALSRVCDPCYDSNQTTSPNSMSPNTFASSLSPQSPSNALAEQTTTESQQ